MKILTILGARPQFVKAATVSRAIAKHNGIQEVIVHTGQHFDTNMSDIFFQEMEIPAPHFNLNINNLSHGAMTGKMLEGIEKILIQQKPDLVLVYGDTNSTLAGSLAARKLDIRVAHVEAGLRSFNMKMPEEINRILTDRISNILFCPTDTAVKNLHKEGFLAMDSKIIRCGDVMFDAALYYAKSASKKSTILKKHNLSKFILCTIHRPENTDDPVKLRSILESLDSINNDMAVVLPLHPRTNNLMKKCNLRTQVIVIDPVGYFDMITLLKHCKLVMTDSGGLQKEAYFFHKHCITMRDQTEWVELVENGYNIVTSSNKKLISDAYNKLINKVSEFDINLYGNGNSSEMIVHSIINE